MKRCCIKRFVSYVWSDIGVIVILFLLLLAFLLSGCAITDGARVADGGASYKRTCTDTKGNTAMTEIVSGRQVTGAQLAVTDPCGGVIASTSELTDHDIIGVAIEQAAGSIADKIGERIPDVAPLIVQ